MTRYTLPEMPVLANLWHTVASMPPSGLPDEIIECSISPIKPEDVFRGTGPLMGIAATHIIRCLVNPNIADSCTLGEPGAIFPCSAWEFPEGSEHFYVTAWYHVVGSGFPNEHARVYVARWQPFLVPGTPTYRGWV